MTDLVPVVSLASEIEGQGPTRRIRTLVDVWLESKESPNTRIAYANDMRHWLRFCEEAGIDPLYQVLRAHVDIWKNRGAGFPGNPPAAASVARRLSAVASWYVYLFQEDVVDRSPLAHVKRPTVSDESMTRGLTNGEAASVYEVAAGSGPRDLAVIALLMLSGLREHEVVLADVEDLGHETGHRTLDIVRKGNKRQRVALSTVTDAAIAGYVQDRTTGPLLTTKTGARISVHQVFRTVKRLARLADVPDPEEVSPHSLRHTFATLSLDAGVPLRQVQVDMGHADPKTTIRYDRARRRLKDAATYKLTEHILGKTDDESGES